MDKIQVEINVKWVWPFFKQCWANLRLD